MVPATSAASSGTLFSATPAGRGQTDRETGISVSAMEGMNANEKLEILNGHLAIQNRIKEGAEKILSNTLDASLREQVESELGSANSRIEAIQKRINIQTTLSKQQAKAAAEKKLQAKASIPALRNDKGGGDDSKTVHQNALSALQELESLSQSPQPSNSSSGEMKTAEALELDHRRIFLMNKVTEILKRYVRVRYELKVLDLLRMAEGCLADARIKRCRATAYRLIRHALVDSEAVTQLGTSLDWYIVKSLQRDNKHATEKEQALKLIRTIIEVSTTNRDGSIATNRTGSVQLSEAIMRAVIAVAEHPEDPFRPICIQTLTEILLMDIELLVRSGGVNVLLHVLADGPNELAPIIVSAFLHIVDSPKTRQYLTIGTDLEMALCAITDAYGKPPDHGDKIKACAKVVQIMLRTWSGLMYFCLDDMAAIRSLVNTLRIPSLETRDLILDMFFDLLNIKTPEWYQTFIDGRRLTMYRRRSAFPRQNERNDDRDDETLKLTDQYLALLLVVLTNAGLCDALVAMTEESTMGTNLSRKATLLLAEVLAMGNRVLPLSIAGKIQAIPGVFAMATDYQNEEHRIVGTSAMSAIDSFNRNKSRLEVTNPKSDTRPRANSIDDAVRRGQRQVEQVKLKMSMQMDDKAFQAALLETQIGLTKDHTRWDFDGLHALIEGPLLAPKRMEQVTTGPRVLRRLLDFFDPFKQRFSMIKRIPQNIKWVKLGCTLMSTLTATAEGVSFLREEAFLAQLVKAFAQLDPFNVSSESDPIFSKKRIAETLTYGYLEMLGILSKRTEGIELLEKFKIFTAFYHLSELRSREDLITIIIDNLDYSIDGHSRIVLSKALTSSYKSLRLYATQHLGSLVRNSPTANPWTLRLLLTQLYDPSPDVCSMAVMFLQEACTSREVLQLLVDMQPTIDHLGDIGHPLTLKFMSATMGFRYLYDTGYIDRESDLWFNERNIDYVVLVEVYLARVFSPSDEDDLLPEFDGSVPPHFYGELVKTELGCQVLQEKGHFADFAQFIRQHGHECEDPDMIIKLKSILWAVGNIGASEGGLHFLEEEEVIPDILEILEQSPIPSVRGTCFFVLGLISSTSQGAEVLDDYQWEATLSPLGYPTGICIPADVDGFVSLLPWSPKVPPSLEPQLMPPTAEHEIEIVAAIQNLSNTVIANAASRTLTKLKAKSESKAAFNSPEMLYRALHIISTQRYRFPVRRYIMDLFNVGLNPEVSASLAKTAQKLKVSPSQRPPRVDTLRLSVFGRMGPRRESESDESDGDDGIDSLPARTTVQKDDKPPISLEPRRRIVGFASS